MLLRNFAFDGLVPVYETTTGRTFQSSPENIALENRYYDIRLDDEVLSLEGWLANLEGEAAPVLRQLIRKPSELLDLPEAAQQTLARFVAALDLRGPGMRTLDHQIRERTLEHLKEAGQQWLRNQFKQEDADEIWKAWEEKPDEWFFNEEEPYQPAKTTAFMLGEVQNFANILMAMPWRIGLPDANLPVYLSDNPVARYRVTTVRWAGYGEHVYYLPFTPRIVLKIGPHIAEGEPPRMAEDFSGWETSLIRHIVTANASRHLYGQGPYVPSVCATACLSRISRANASSAVKAPYSVRRRYSVVTREGSDSMSGTTA